MEDNKAKTSVPESGAGIGANAGADQTKELEVSKKATDTADSVNGQAFEEQGAEGKEPDAESAKKAQSREQNAENARRRREAEKQKEMRELRNKTIIDTLRGQNPYTQEAMKDDADVEEYLAMRAIEEKGGDPISDFPKYQKQKEREAAQKQAEDQEKQDWIKKDIESFQAKHPSVNLEELLANESFLDYADGKDGKPLSEIYSGFLKFVGNYEARAKDLAAQMLANQTASPGALQNTQEVQSDYFTSEQVRKMTPSEIKKNYEKIRKSMANW